MTLTDHTRAWKRLCRALVCPECHGLGARCRHQRRTWRARLRAIWRRHTSTRELAHLRRQVESLRGQLDAMELAAHAQTVARKRAESDLAAERFVKAALLDTMTPGIRRGKA